MARLKTTWDNFDFDAVEMANVGASHHPVSDFANPVDDFFAGEPIIAPPRPPSLPRRLLRVVLLGCAAWGSFQAYLNLPAWVWASLAHQFENTTLEITTTTRSESAPLLKAPAPLEPMETHEVGVVPGSEPSRFETVHKAAATPPAENSETNIVSGQPSEAETATPQIETGGIPRPTTVGLDPYERRAAAAGLNPKLSRVVLTSLTEADYRNAKEAIRKALAETGDSDKLVFPKKPSGKEAKFQIHFVPGENSGCRRYVVTIVKNGWTTTAAPMEKCGLQIPSRDAVATTGVAPNKRQRM